MKKRVLVPVRTVINDAGVECYLMPEHQKPGYKPGKVHMTDTGEFLIELIPTKENVKQSEWEKPHQVQIKMTMGI